MPTGYDKYKKPVAARLKKTPGNKHRANMPEPDLFDGIMPSSKKDANHVTPLKIKKSKTTWEVQKVSRNEHTADIFDPMRFSTKVYTLVHRSDKSGFPASVKRCEECKVVFMPSDVIAVKTYATREYTGVNGKQHVTHGNVYLHYLQSCLKKHDQKFEFKPILVPNKTKIHLSDDQIAKLCNTGCIFEEL